MKRLVTLSLLVIVTGTWFVYGAQAQTGNQPTKSKWVLHGACMEVRLEPTALVTTHRTNSFLEPAKCQNSNDTNLKAELESTPRSIPFAFIERIIFEDAIRRPVQEEVDRALESLHPENLPSTISEASDAGAGALAAPVLLLAEAGTLAPFRKIKIHLALVRIIWTEDGAERSAGFLLSRKDAESLLGRLAQVTGKGWSELRFDTGGRNRNLQLRVHLDQPVNLGEVTVFGGSYKFLIVWGSDSTPLVYVLHENYRSLEEAITVLQAVQAPLGSGNPWKVKLMPTANGSFCVSEIHTDVQRLELLACGVSRKRSPSSSTQ